MTTATARQLRRFTVAEYHAMISTGIVRGGEPVELLDGLLVNKMTRNPPHATALGKMEDALIARLPAGWIRRSQDAITLADSEPEPDVVIVRGTRDDYAARHPGPGDIALVVEVSDSSLDIDQGIKLRIYAAAGIPVYWIVNIPDDTVEVYTQPVGTGDQATYARRQILRTGDNLDLTLDGFVLPPIPVADVLP